MNKKNSQGYVLISVLVVLLTVLSAVVAVNNSYTNSIVIDAETNTVARQEIEKSAHAHLHAYAEQNNCGIDPANIKVSGEKDGFEYSLNWNKNPTGTKLTASYNAIGDDSTSWNTTQNHIEIYGSTQSTSWVLASYFSDFVKIRYGDDSHHRDHNDHDLVRISNNKNIVLRSLKLGPLLTEPVSLIGAELQLTSTSTHNNANELRLNAIKYPWDPEDVTFTYNGLGTNTLWPEPLYDKFETLSSTAVSQDEIVKFDMTGLLKSWIDGNRPNYGFAIASSGSEFEWITKAKDNNFERRPRINLKYRCACGEACVGIKQNEAIALASLTSIEGYGGSRDKLTKLWLHRSNEDYLTPKIPSTQVFGRTEYQPAGLSAFDVNNSSGEPGWSRVIGLHVEPANNNHPNFHYYTVMTGSPVNVHAHNLPSGSSNSLIHLQSPGDEAVGVSLTKRVSTITPPTAVSDQAVFDYTNSNDYYVGGFSYWDDRYWFAQTHASANNLQDYPVEVDSSENSLHKIDLGKVQLNLDQLEFDSLHAPHALHVIDKNNFLITGIRYGGTLDYTSDFGRLKSYDGDIVLYNAITKKSRMINDEVGRSISNNLSALGLFEEPIPPTGSSDSRYKEALPTLFE